MERHGISSAKKQKTRSGSAVSRASLLNVVWRNRLGPRQTQPVPTPNGRKFRRRRTKCEKRGCGVCLSSKHSPPPPLSPIILSFIIYFFFFFFFLFLFFSFVSLSFGRVRC